MSNISIQHNFSPSNDVVGIGEKLDLMKVPTQSPRRSGSKNAKQLPAIITRVKSAENPALDSRLDMRMGIERSFSQQDIKSKKPGMSLDLLLDDDGKRNGNYGYGSASVCSSINNILSPQKASKPKAVVPKLAPSKREYLTPTTSKRKITIGTPSKREILLETTKNEVSPPRTPIAKATSLRDLAIARREMITSSKGDDEENGNQSSKSLLGLQRDTDDFNFHRTVQKTRRQSFRRNGSKKGMETKDNERKPMQRSQSFNSGLRKKSSYHDDIQQTEDIPYNSPKAKSLLNDVFNMESKSELFDAEFDFSIFDGIEPANEKHPKDNKCDRNVVVGERNGEDPFQGNKSTSSDTTTKREPSFDKKIKRESDDKNDNKLNLFNDIDLDATVDEAALMKTIETKVRRMEPHHNGKSGKHREPTSNRSNNSDSSKDHSKRNKKNHHSKKQKDERKHQNHHSKSSRHKDDQQVKHRRPPPARRIKSDETSSRCSSNNTKNNIDNNMDNKACIEKKNSIRQKKVNKDFDERHDHLKSNDPTLQQPIAIIIQQQQQTDSDNSESNKSSVVDNDLIATTATTKNTNNDIPTTSKGKVCCSNNNNIKVVSKIHFPTKMKIFGFLSRKDNNHVIVK